MTLWKHEMKMNLKSLLIWSICVGASCFGCLLLFKGLESTMDEMAGAYADMGSFSVALGLDKVAINTVEGFYATEVALIFAIGGAMFAAMCGAGILAKEEEAHTSEFLSTLPMGRINIVGAKYAAFAVLVFLFQVICIGWILVGFAGAGDFPPAKEFMMYHGLQFVMQLEIGSVCFLISACCKKRQTGAALGLALLLYMVDLMCRILPDIKNLKYITPFYYSNASDIFTDPNPEPVMIGIGMAVTLACAVISGIVYSKRDLAA